MRLSDPALMELEPFRACLADLRAGRLAAAEDRARSLLTARPGSVDLWHMLGAIAARGGDVGEALVRFDRAVALAPDRVPVLFDRAVALGRLGRHAEALSDCDRVLALAPDHVGALVNRGHALRVLERHEAALESYGRAATLRPDLAEALHGRAHALAALGRHGAALAAYDRLVDVAPEMVEALIGRGNVLAALDRPEEGLACFDRAVALVTNPPAGRTWSAETTASAYFFRGDALRVAARYEEALGSFAAALAACPTHIDSWLGRGRVMLETRAYDEALACHDAALRIDPRHAAAHDHRSRALRELGRYEDALAAAEESLRLKPDDTGAVNSRANALRMLGRTQDAAAAYADAVGRTPANGPLRFNHAVCLLAMGDFERGWPEYEYRWTLERLARRRPRFHQPLWLGREEIAGRRILLYAEQGLGDTIQFCRYAPLVAARGAVTILGVQPELRPLLEGMAGVADVRDRTQDPPIFDCHAPLLSLPLAFGTRESSIPAAVPYLTVPAEYQATWRERVGAGPRIGIVWSGNPDHMNDHNRSIPLQALAPILDLGLPLHCLQRDLRPADVPAFAMARNIRLHGPDLADFRDTAALVARMDVVITVDTAVAHLAGALGRPTWLLLPYAPDWRWLLGRDDSPWYPTMRLFRQPQPMDWASVILRVRDALMAFVAGTPPSGS